jgi:hypothetical protein
VKISVAARTSLLQRTEGKTGVYFFTNKVDASKMKAVVRAESTSSEAPTPVEYSLNTFRIAAIRLLGKTLKSTAAE